MNDELDRDVATLDTECYAYCERAFSALRDIPLGRDTIPGYPIPPGVPPHITPEMTRNPGPGNPV